MSRSYFTMLLLSLFLILMFPSGLGWKLVDSFGQEAAPLKEGMAREMMQLDYDGEPGANPKNSKNFFFNSGVPSPAPPPPPPSWD